jgi:hypothetical protein
MPPHPRALSSPVSPPGALSPPLLVLALYPASLPRLIPVVLLVVLALFLPADLVLISPLPPSSSPPSSSPSSHLPRQAKPAISRPWTQALGASAPAAHGQRRGADADTRTREEGRRREREEAESRTKTNPTQDVTTRGRCRRGRRCSAGGGGGGARGGAAARTRRTRGGAGAGVLVSGAAQARLKPSRRCRHGGWSPSASLVRRSCSWCRGRRRRGGCARIPTPARWGKGPGWCRRRARRGGDVRDAAHEWAPLSCAGKRARGRRCSAGARYCRCADSTRTGREAAGPTGSGAGTGRCLFSTSSMLHPTQGERRGGRKVVRRAEGNGGVGRRVLRRGRGCCIRNSSGTRVAWPHGTRQRVYVHPPRI